ncbi:hypothetical protein CBR_g76107, partial [Chara braunii]
MSGKVIYRNLMGILMMGVEQALDERAEQRWGVVVEEAVKLCLQILVLAFSKDSMLAEMWRPTYQ